jgi:hypothetical protein
MCRDVESNKKGEEDAKDDKRDVRAAAFIGEGRQNIDGNLGTAMMMSN